MSLLEAPRHLLMVQKRKRVQGTAGFEWVPDGAPIEVRGNLHPMSADALLQLGIVAQQAWDFHTRDWPGDMHSDATLPDGTVCDVHAPAKHFDMSPSTAHFEVVLRRRN